MAFNKAIGTSDDCFAICSCCVSIADHTCGKQFLSMIVFYGISSLIILIVQSFCLRVN